jgi:hypothetical protein
MISSLERGDAGFRFVPVFKALEQKISAENWDKGEISPESVRQSESKAG